MFIIYKNKKVYNRNYRLFVKLCIIIKNYFFPILTSIFFLSKSNFPLSPFAPEFNRAILCKDFSPDKFNLFPLESFRASKSELDAAGLSPVLITRFPFTSVSIDVSLSCAFSIALCNSFDESILFFQLKWIHINF